MIPRTFLGEILQRVYFICALANNLSFIYLLSKCYDYKYNHISSIMLGMIT
jgi:hypothetical protein